MESIFCLESFMDSHHVRNSGFVGFIRIRTMSESELRIEPLQKLYDHTSGSQKYPPNKFLRYKQAQHSKQFSFSETSHNVLSLVGRNATQDIAPRTTPSLHGISDLCTFRSLDISAVSAAVNSRLSSFAMVPQLALQRASRRDRLRSYQWHYRIFGI
jgi:hypothetical protein